VRPVAALALGALLGGCAYFNGVYNAREAERAANRLLRAGREGEASGSFATAAAKAETVLARHPKSRWRDDALYLAGRGHAYSGRCEQAQPRLEEYLSLTAIARSRRDRATLALAYCSYQRGRFGEAIALADPLTTRQGDRELREQASLAAARAAIRLGRTNDAQRYLGAVDAASAQWELATASVAAAEYARAESLLVLRAAQGDYRDELHPALRALWEGGRRDGVERIVARYQRAGGAAHDKAALYLLAADLYMAAGHDSAARAHLVAVPRVSTDTLLRKRAAARITVLNVAELGALPLVEAAIVRGTETARGMPEQMRLEDNLWFIKLLEARRDVTGAALFLAAEVARDSLRSRALAHTLFKRIESELPNSLLAPKALLAACELQPDSADAYRARLRENYGTSPFRLLLDGGDPSASFAYRQSDEVLRREWAAASRALKDTIIARRPPPGGAADTSATAANGTPAAGPPGAAPPPATPPTPPPGAGSTGQPASPAPPGQTPPTQPPTSPPPAP